MSGKLLVDGVDVTQPQTGEMRDVIVIGEFTKGYPDVPNFDGVDIEALTNGDADPVYVTLPVAEVDAISGNRRYYNQDFVTSVERQMQEKRPTAGQGHVPDDQRDTVFPTPAGYWIGAIREGKTLWGKAYVPPGQMRDVVRRLKAAGGKLATSVYGLAKQTYDAARDAWAVSEFVLENIDFAPPDRAGVPSLARVPVLTAEMKSDQKGDENPMTDKLEIFKAMTLDDVKLLPDAVVAEIIKSDGSQNVISEMRGVLEIDEKADLIAYVTGLQKQVAEQKKEALQTSIVAEIAKLVLPDASAEDASVKAVRGIVAEMVANRSPQDAEGAVKAVKEVVELESIQTMLAKLVIAEMGPKLGKKVTTDLKGGEKVESEYLEPLPEEEKAS